MSYEPRQPYSPADLDPAIERGMEIIGVALRTARRRRGWTQAQLGGICGLSQSTISKLEGGRLVSIRFRRFARIVESLAELPLDAPR